MLVLKKDKKSERSYRFGRILLIVLAIASIPLDLQKASEEIEKSKMYLNKSMLDTVSFYSATISIHFVGIASAWEHEIWLTISCRLLSAIIYQYELNSRTNETLPNDPDELQKVLREKYPHKYPPNHQAKRRTTAKKSTSNRQRKMKPTTKFNPRSAAKKPMKSTKKPIKNTKKL